MQLPVQTTCIHCAHIVFLLFAILVSQPVLSIERLDGESYKEYTERYKRSLKQSKQDAVQAPGAEIQTDYKRSIVDSCKKRMEQYGASIVKACADKDIAAFEALQGYPPRHSKVIEGCVRRMENYGYAIVKACADKDIAAQQALDSY